MFVIILFMTISLTVLISNKLINLDDDNENAYQFDTNENYAIFGLFCLGLVLETLKTVMSAKVFWLVAFFYFMLISIVMIILNSQKRARIDKMREDSKEVYDILQKLIDPKNKGFDYNNILFELSYKYGDVCSVKLPVDPTTVEEVAKKGKFDTFVNQFNTFYPKYNWSFRVVANERYMEFVGSLKPPIVANWSGSWLHNTKHIPVGVSDKGEVLWKMADVPKNRKGRSQFVNEFGQLVEVDWTTPVTPQALIGGGTNGGKAIGIKQEIDV